MVYKRYIKKRVNGKLKVFGPYYYESYRDQDGKVRTRYVPDPKDSSKKSNVTNKKNFKHLSFFIAIGIIFLLSAGFLILNSQTSNQEIIFSDNARSALEGVGGPVKGIYITTKTFFTDKVFSITGFVVGDEEEQPEEVIQEEIVEEILEEVPEEILEEAPEPEEVILEEVVEEILEEEILVEESNETFDEPVNETIEPVENITEIPEENVTEIINETNITIPETNITLEENITTLEENLTEIINETISTKITEPEINITPINTTIPEEVILNETIENITIVNETLEVATNISLKQYKIVLGKPVKWEKTIRVNVDEAISNLTLNLPILAGNVSVKKIDKQTGEKKKLKINVKNEKKIEEIEAIIEVEEDTGSSISTIFNFFLSIAGRITGMVVEGGVEENVIVEIDEEVLNEEEVVVEYYTDAPYAEEKIVSENKKEIVVVGPDEVHYEDVLAFSNLPPEITEWMVDLFWIVNDSRIEVDFEFFDLDEDGFGEYIEWIVPHLSNQSYELEITILNVQSYPTVGGNWTVEFNTTGEANLTISVINGTTWGIGNESFERDLEFLELRCGESVVNSTIILNYTEIPFDVYEKKKRIEEIRRVLG